ncbi:MAG: hypothetical protein WBG63_06585 [Phormidesmis sp.]
MTLANSCPKSTFPCKSNSHVQVDDANDLIGTVYEDVLIFADVPAEIKIG